MRYETIIKILPTAVVLGLFVLVLNAPAPAQTNDSGASRQQLIERFRAHSKSDHKAAYEAAKEFFQKYPDDNSDDAQYMRRWVAAYEKIELSGQPSSSSDSQPTNNSGSISSPTDAETPEVAEARIAITKYKDYQGAIKALESSSPETKRKPLWLYYMAIAQEGVGNEAEELKYLERYNELVPNQKETVEKLADLRYRVKKKLAAANEKAEKERKELEEESRFGNLEQTFAWLKANAPSQGGWAIKYIEFQGAKMIWSWNCSADRLKHDDCSIRSVPLRDLDLSKLEGWESDDQYIINIHGKNDSEVITTHRTYKGKPYLDDFRDKAEYQFQLQPKEAARTFFLALRHAIRLSQQQ